MILVGASSLINKDPQGLFSNFTALPIQIYNWTSRPQAEFRNIAAAAIIVLLVVLLSLNAVAILSRNRLSEASSHDRNFRTNSIYAIETRDMHLLLRRISAPSKMSICKIEPQKITAIIGPSGCGKSTVLRSFNRMNDLVPGFPHGRGDPVPRAEHL